MKTISLMLGLALLVVGLTGCGEVALHHQLTEFEADKILVLLDKNDITASKERQVDGQDITWTINVGQSNVAAARRLLVENNLPQRPELGLSGVYSEKGLIPTPEEQRARFLLALKGEIINALRKIPGVHEVGVVLNVPAKREMDLGDSEPVRPSASVVLRLADPSMLHAELTEEKIRRFVANAIPELEPSNVIVLISSEGGAGAPRGKELAGAFPPPPIRPPSGDGPSGGGGMPPAVSAAGSAATNFVEVAGIRLDPVSVGRLRVYLIVFLCVLILLSAALLVTLFRFSQMRGHGGTRRLTALPLDEEAGAGTDLLTAGQEAMGVGDKH